MTSRVLLIDTSVAVALAVSDHEHHSATVNAIGRRPLGLSGHAAFEIFSVLLACRRRFVARQAPSFTF